jgi:hypothetical protein
MWARTFGAEREGNGELAKILSLSAATDGHRQTERDVYRSSAGAARSHATHQPDDQQNKKNRTKNAAADIHSNLHACA